MKAKLPELKKELTRLRAIQDCKPVADMTADEVRKQVVVLRRKVQGAMKPETPKQAEAKAAKAAAKAAKAQAKADAKAAKAKAKADAKAAKEQAQAEAKARKAQAILDKAKAQLAAAKQVAASTLKTAMKKVPSRRPRKARLPTT